MHEDAMKQLFGSTLALAALLSLVPACEQPKAGCTAGVGAFAAKYTLKPGSKVGQGSCDALKGEILGLLKYNPLKEGETTVQDLTKVSLAIRTNTLGEVAVDCASVAGGGNVACVEDKTQVLASIGDFVSTTPDENDVCSVPKLSPAAQQVAMFTTTPAPRTCRYDNNGTVMEIPRPLEVHPATNLKYEWSNVRLYVTAAYPGTQMVADLTYTDADSGCTASYSVNGLWPAVSCRVVEEVKDADGNLTCDKDGNVITTTKLDPALCDPVADPSAGRPTGSGINPDLKKRVECDTATGLCVLAIPPDALK
jgi:hypothetical protein